MLNRYHMKTRMLFLILSSSLWLAVVPCRAQDTDTYISRFKDLAEAEMLRTGIPAAISLAQGIVESGSGSGWLAQNANNYFGIKCKNNWQGATVSHDDDLKNECFRKYPDVDASWRDHSDFLKQSPRYAFLFALDPRDYKGWAKGLKKAGYATSRTYAEKLVEVIERYNLQQYTEEALGKQQEKVNRDFAAMLDQKVASEAGTTAPEVARPEPEKPSVIRPAFPEKAFAINGLRVVYVRAHTPLAPVAEKHHVKLRRLLRYNDLRSETLNEGRLIYLQRPRKTGAHETHVVREGETMDLIARREGIRLDWLYKRNRLAKGTQPAPGTELVLRGYVPKTAGANHSFLARIGKAASGKSEPTRPEVSPQAPGAAADPGQPKAIYTGTSSAAPAEKDPATSTSEPRKPVTHLVRKGETLYSLSKTYGASVDQLRAWNHLEGNNIRVGQTLVVGR